MNSQSQKQIRLNQKTRWPADLEFLEASKSQGILWHFKKVREKIREFHEIQKSEGILMQNWEKSGNFTSGKRISSKFFQNSFKW